MTAGEQPTRKTSKGAGGAITGRRRYPGARPFEDSPQDEQVFHGRAADIERLYERVLGTRLLVLFGKSGLGKTSLLNAGLFPRLRLKAYLPVPIRLNGSQAASATVIAAIDAAAANRSTSVTAGDRTGLWEYLRTTLIWRDGLLLTPVLVFDQFEEAFTLRDAAFRDELAAELGALASGLPPVRLEAAGWLGGSAPEVKTLLSLREEYLGMLQDISLAIPGLFQERVRLAPLSDDDARQAIVQPAARVADAGEVPFLTPPFEYTDDALRKMLAFLRGGSKIIEPFQLQLLCGDVEDRIAARAPQGGVVKVSSADLGGDAGMDSVLSRFYEGAIQTLPVRLRGRARRLCEEGLLSAGGRRLMLDQTQVRNEFGLDADELARLVDKRLLRAELRLESIFYEISHDRLADSINRQRPMRIPKRWRVPLAVAGMAGAAGVAMLVWFNITVSHERDRAEAAATQAERATARVKAFNSEAVAAREMADKALVETGQALTQARAARDDAESVVSFMIGDSFLEKLRPVGRDEILEEVQTRVQRYIDQSAQGGAPSGAKTRGLALRNQADILRARGRLAESVVAYGESAKAFAETLDGEGDRARALDLLSDALETQGRVDPAMAAAREALALRVDLARSPRADDSAVLDVAESHGAVGRLYNKMGRPRTALTQHLDKALAVLQPMREKRSWSPRLHKALHEVLDNKASAQRLMGNWNGAKATSQAAFEVAKSWLESQPLAADARQRQIIATSRIANDMFNDGEVQLAMARYQAIHQAVDELVRWDGRNERWKRDLEATRILLAEGHMAAKNYPEAHAAFDKALIGLKRVDALDKSSREAKEDLGWLHGSRGALAKAEERWQQAAVEYEASARYFAAAAAGAAASETIQQRHYLALRALAEAQSKSGQPAKALATLRRGRDLARSLAQAAPEMNYVLAGDVRVFYDDELNTLDGKLSAGAKAAINAAKRKLLSDLLPGRPDNAELLNQVSIDDIDVGNEAVEPADKIAAYERGISRLRQALALDGKNAVYWGNLRAAWSRIARVERDRKNVAAARRAYGQAQQACERAYELAANDKGRAKYARLLHSDQLALATVDMDAGEPAAAARSLLQARAWIEKAAAAAPTSAEDPAALAVVQRRLAAALLAQGDKATAAAAQRAAGEAAERAASVSVTHEPAAVQPSRITALRKHFLDLADAQAEQGEPATAAASLKAGIEALERIAGKLPTSQATYGGMQELQARLAELLAGMGDAEAVLGQRRASAQSALRAAEPGGSAQALYTASQRQWQLGEHLGDARRWAEALAAYREGAGLASKAIALDPKSDRSEMAMAYHQRSIGETLNRSGHDAEARPAFEAAVAAAQKAVAALPTAQAYWQILVMSQRSLAGHLDRRGLAKEALEVLQAALESAEQGASLKEPYDGSKKDVEELRALIGKRGGSGT